MSNIRVTYTILQPVTVGLSSIRLSFAFAQSVIDGYSAIRLSNILVEPLIDGYSKVRANYQIVQALFPHFEEPPMPTTPFPGFGNSATNPAVPAALDPFDSPLPGLSIEVIKRPMFSTKINESSAGNEIRTSFMDWPRWEFELSYEFLEDRTGAESSLKTIMGFFVDQQGSFGSWLFKDPDDYLVANGLMGVADGVTTEFYFRRYLGTRGEPVGQVDQSNDIEVYLDGVLVNSADYTVYQNRIVFVTAPVSGDVTANFQFFYVCRFLEDQMEFDKFADKLWSLQTCEFKSILT